jgi:surface antigen
MRHYAVLAFAISVSTLSGCATTSVPAPDTVTTGAVELSNIPRPSQAALFIGDAADRMDEQSRKEYLVAQMAALDGGAKTTFENDAMGVLGSVEVGPSSLTALHPDMECRRYSSVVWVVGNGRMVEGDACRDEGGPWQAMGMHETKS